MIEKMSWTDRVKSEEVLYRVKEEINILRTVKRRRVSSIGLILSGNCLLEHVIEEWRDEEESVSSYRMTLRKTERIRTLRGSDISHAVEILL
jgi:hypothetical protein